MAGSGFCRRGVPRPCRVNCAYEPGQRAYPAEGGTYRAKARGGWYHGALSALELYEGGGGILRYLVSHDPETAFVDGAPEPEVEIRDGSGRRYGWGLEGSSGNPGEEEGTLEVFDLPDSGDLEIRVVRVVSTEPPDGTISEAHEGPWGFRLSL